jgi:hypothetical protein
MPWPRCAIRNRWVAAKSSSLFTEPRGGADPQHEVCGVTGLLDDLVPCQVGHGRPGDRSGEPVPCLDEVVLRLLIRLHGPSQTSRCSRLLTGRDRAASYRQPDPARAADPRSTRFPPQLLVNQRRILGVPATTNDRAASCAQPNAAQSSAVSPLNNCQFPFWKSTSRTGRTADTSAPPARSPPAGTGSRQMPSEQEPVAQFAESAARGRTLPKRCLIRQCNRPVSCSSTLSVTMPTTLRSSGPSSTSTPPALARVIPSNTRRSSDRKKKARAATDRAPVLHRAGHRVDA